MTRGWVIGAAVAVAVVGASVVGFQVLTERERQADRREATDVGARWLRAWQDGQYAAVDPLSAGSDAPGGALERTDERLQAASKVLTPGPLSPDGTQLPYTATATLTGLGEFTWASRLRLVQSSRGWRVAFDAMTVHPDLVNGQRLDRRSRPTPRAEIVDRTGRPVRAASADLASNVLGRPARPGGTASGLERVLSDRRAGRPSGAVVLSSAESGAELRELQAYAGTPPVPVRTTLDLAVQAAAEQALVGLDSPSALVAVDSATGEIRAAASLPVAGRPRAFTSYAPGSVFKVVTAAALLDSGLALSSPLDCPDTFRGTGNASTVRPGPTTLLGAFTQSCNTAFLSAAERLPQGALARSAKAFGFGLDQVLPIAAESGDFPTGGGSADATAAIGQGRVEASPLLMASVLAAAESGTWRQPSLVPGTPGLVQTPLAPATAAGLRTMLRSAVESGSGSAADLPGSPVFGKTGTAELGGGEMHAWFAGYRDGLAFCVFVERGTSGGATAAPVGARFLRALG